MKSIWKYELSVVGRQLVELPEGAQILSVQMQDENLCLWALVETEAAMQARTIHVVGTGHDAERVSKDFMRFVGTVQTLGGALVWHIFEGKVS